MEKCCLPQEEEANSSSPIPTKLCLICTGFPEDCAMDDCAMDIRYYVFILDPSENSVRFIPRVPDLMFQGFGSYMSFCALNSSIYIFDSCTGNEEKKSVYTCDLSAFLSEKDDSNLNISTLKDNSNSLLQPAPPMLGRKEEAASVATPRGQIIVFSRCIYFDSTPERVDFELYDPLTKSWRVLPRLYPKRNGSIFRITAYSLLSESLFCVVTMPDIGKRDRFAQTFALDLDHDQESLQWNRLDMSSLGLNNNVYGRFFVIDEDMYLTRGGVIRRGDGCTLLKFPCSCTHEFDHVFHDASLMNVSSNQELRFCSLESMFSYDKDAFYTTVDSWCCDLAKYKAEINNNKECRLSATRNTFKFLPKVEVTLDCFYPNTILPIGGYAAVTSNSSFWTNCKAHPIDAELQKLQVEVLESQQLSGETGETEHIQIPIDTILHDVVSVDKKKCVFGQGSRSHSLAYSSIGSNLHPGLSQIDIEAILQEVDEQVAERVEEIERRMEEKDKARDEKITSLEATIEAMRAVQEGHTRMMQQWMSSQGTPSFHGSSPIKESGG